jgi:hypothetical protein
MTLVSVGRIRPGGVPHFSRSLREVGIVTLLVWSGHFCPPLLTLKVRERERLDFRSKPDSRGGCRYVF